MDPARDVEVELHFIPTNRGGKSNPVRSGYRPQFFYRGQDWDAHHTYIEREVVQPGDTVRAYLTFLSPQLHVGHVFEGMPFIVREGQLTVAYGRVLRVLDLKVSAERMSRFSGQDSSTGAAP